MSTEAVAVAMGFKLGQPLALEQTCIDYGIESTLEKCHFLSQVAHESGCGRHTREIWGPTRAQLKYEGRLDLGNTAKGDGYRFKGRGLIQTTGRQNYSDYSMDTYGDMRVVEDPEMLEYLPDAALCAGWFWRRKGCGPLALRDDIEAVTRRINGGINGLEDRKRWLKKAKAEFAKLTA